MGFFTSLFRTDRSDDYARVIADTASMVSAPGTSARALTHGLRFVNVAWEDTARFQGSCVGPNISDLTIPKP